MNVLTCILYRSGNFVIIMFNVLTHKIPVFNSSTFVCPTVYKPQLYSSCTEILDLKRKLEMRQRYEEIFDLHVNYNFYKYGNIYIFTNLLITSFLGALNRFFYSGILRDKTMDNISKNLSNDVLQNYPIHTVFFIQGS